MAWREQQTTTTNKNTHRNSTKDYYQIFAKGRMLPLPKTLRHKEAELSLSLWEGERGFNLSLKIQNWLLVTIWHCKEKKTLILKHCSGSSLRTLSRAYSYTRNEKDETQMSCIQNIKPKQNQIFRAFFGDEHSLYTILGKWTQLWLLLSSHQSKLSRSKRAG